MKVPLTLTLLEILLFQVFWYCDLSSGSQSRRQKVYVFSRNCFKKMFALCWSYLKSDCSFEVLNRFYFFLILLNHKGKDINQLGIFFQNITDKVTVYYDYFQDVTVSILISPARYREEKIWWKKILISAPLFENNQICCQLQKNEWICSN